MHVHTIPSSLSGFTSPKLLYHSFKKDYPKSKLKGSLSVKLIFNFLYLIYTNVIFFPNYKKSKLNNNRAWVWEYEASFRVYFCLDAISLTI